MSSLISSAMAVVNLNYTKTADGPDPLTKGSISNTVSYTNGTGADQADIYFVDEFSLSSGGNTTYDLSGALTNSVGETVVFARIKTIYLANTSSAAAILTVGGGSDGAGAAAFVNWVGAANDKINVRKGGHIELSATDATAYAVTAATADILRIEETGSQAATGVLILVGASA